MSSTGIYIVFNDAFWLFTIMYSIVLHILITCSFFLIFIIVYAKIGLFLILKRMFFLLGCWVRIDATDLLICLRFLVAFFYLIVDFWYFFPYYIQLGMYWTLDTLNLISMWYFFMLIVFSAMIMFLTHHVILETMVRLNRERYFKKKEVIRNFRIGRIYSVQAEWLWYKRGKAYKSSPMSS